MLSIESETLLVQKRKPFCIKKNQLVLNSVMIELMTNMNIHERRLSDTQFSQRRVGCGSLIRACLNILAVFVFLLFCFVKFA